MEGNSMNVQDVSIIVKQKHISPDVNKLYIN